MEEGGGRVEEGWRKGGGRVEERVEEEGVEERGREEKDVVSEEGKKNAKRPIRASKNRCLLFVVVVAVCCCCSHRRTLGAVVLILNPISAACVLVSLRARVAARGEVSSNLSSLGDKEMCEGLFDDIG